LKSSPQPMTVSAAGNGFGPLLPGTAARGLASVIGVGVLISTSGVNGGVSTPLWKKSPCPASAS